MISGKIEGNAAQAIRAVVEFANLCTIEGRAVPEKQGQRVRQELIRDLCVVASGTRLPASDLSILLERAKHLSISPQGYDAQGGAVIYTFSYWNWAAMCSYQVLVLDAARRDGKYFPGDLRRCRLDSCGRFFFMSDLRESFRGRPRSTYCCAEHMLAQHLTTSADRVARHRKRRRAARLDSGQDESSLGGVELLTRIGCDDLATGQDVSVDGRQQMPAISRSG
jgi:hypothetical protein